jgi:hypothetical protein
MDGQKDRQTNRKRMNVLNEAIFFEICSNKTLYYVNNSKVCQVLTNCDFGFDSITQDDAKILIEFQKSVANFRMKLHYIFHQVTEQIDMR